MQFYSNMMGGSSTDAMESSLQDPQPSMSSLIPSSVPGLLTLLPSRAEALIAREPIHELYSVENQPFAR